MTRCQGNYCPRRRRLACCAACSVSVALCMHSRFVTCVLGLLVVRVQCLVNTPFWLSKFLGVSSSTPPLLFLSDFLDPCGYESDLPIYYIKRKLPRISHFLHIEFGSKVIARRLGPRRGPTRVFSNRDCARPAVSRCRVPCDMWPKTALGVKVTSHVFGSPTPGVTQSWEKK